MATRKPDPVRVYLDSSDISYLSDASKLAANKSLQDVRAELIDLAGKGLAEFRFSYFHIIELAHLDAARKPDALARAEFVKLLCGRHAHLHPGKLRRFEALSLIQDGKPETGRGAKARAFVEDASWLPDSIAEVARAFTKSAAARAAQQHRHPHIGGGERGCGEPKRKAGFETEALGSAGGNAGSRQNRSQKRRDVSAALGGVVPAHQAILGGQNAVSASGTEDHRGRS